MKRNGLLCVKSIMTIVLTVALCVLTFMYPEQYAETMKACVTMVVTFYFAHQIDKRGENNEIHAGKLQGGRQEQRCETEESNSGEDSEDKV